MAKFSAALEVSRAWLIWHACELGVRLTLLRYLRAEPAH